MNIISQREEQILLAIWELKDEAYLVGIKKYLSRVMKRNWTVGAIHKPLRRLERTGCKIVVGQNGRVWLKGNNIDIAIKAIRKIEREAQSKGLTDRIEEFLSNELRSSGEKNEKG